MRLTKIICTLGPATNNEEGIRTLASLGMNIARMNFSHGSQESQTEVMNRIKECNERDGHTVGLLLDTKGAEIRTGDRPEPLAVTEGQTVVFSHKKTEDEFPVINVNYAEFAQDAKEARFILIDSGELILDIVKIEDDRVVATSKGNFAIGSRRHINLPGSNVTLPSLAEKDWLDIELACKEKLDYIALSFIRNAAEIEEVRAFVAKHGHPDIQLISKIENEIAVKNIAEIIEASDGVMIARGDLGAEIPLETLPAIQDDIVERCRAAGKPVIVATHMLESMIKNPMPTRAEVTDVAHAAMSRADSTMLSGETAAGKFPFEALTMMSKIAEATERRIAAKKEDRRAVSSDQLDMDALSAVNMAEESRAAAIVVFGQSCEAAHAVSRLRPTVPVFAMTDDADAARGMQILFGVYPMVTSFDQSADVTIDNALSMLQKKDMIASGSAVVIVSDAENGRARSVQSRTL